LRGALSGRLHPYPEVGRGFSGSGMTNKYRILSRRFIFDQSGTTAIEYAIIVTLLAAAIIPITHSVGLTIAAKLASTEGVYLWWVQ
jgi:Flp pilus assembly pilin Flp